MSRRATERLCGVDPSLAIRAVPMDGGTFTKIYQCYGPATGLFFLPASE